MKRSPAQRRRALAQSRELLELAQTAPHAGSRVARKAMGAAQRVEILDGGGRELDAHTALQRVQWKPVPARGLAHTERCAFVGAVDAVE
jgi:hypothetical protein